MDGYRPLDKLINESRSYIKKSGNKKMILIAPLGAKIIYEVCIDKLIDNLLNLDVMIVIRPHPMTIKHEYEQINNLKEKYFIHENIVFQLDTVNRSTLFESDILITDWSGIGMEYGLGLLKPVIYIDTPKK